MDRVPTGQGKLQKVRESPGKCKSDCKVREMLGKIFTFSTVVVMKIHVIAVRLESNPAYRYCKQ